MKELAIREQLTGIEDSKAAQIEATFAPMVELLKGFEGAYDTVMAMDQSEEKCSTAKRLRLDIAKIRVSAKKHTTNRKQIIFLLAERLTAYSTSSNWRLRTKKTISRKLKPFLHDRKPRESKLSEKPGLASLRNSESTHPLLISGAWLMTHI